MPKSVEKNETVNDVIENVIKLKHILKNKQMELKEHRKKISELEQKLYSTHNV